MWSILTTLKKIWNRHTPPRCSLDYFFAQSPNLNLKSCLQFSSVQSLSHVRLFATPWIAARQACLSITNSQSSLRFTSIESAMLSSHLILCRPFLLLPPIPPSIKVFSNESTLRVRWPKYWSFSFSIIPSREIPGLISFRMDWENGIETCILSCNKRITSLCLIQDTGCCYILKLCYISIFVIIFY